MSLNLREKFALLLISALITCMVVLWCLLIFGKPKGVFIEKLDIVEEFTRLCIGWCKEIDESYNLTTIDNIRKSDWCTKKILLYRLTCPTGDKCYSQREGENCNKLKDQFSHEYPEKVKVNCSFHLTTGELCNPDAIEDGWIKCCENPSLENCNCK